MLLWISVKMGAIPGSWSGYYLFHSEWLEWCCHVAKPRCISLEVFCLGQAWSKHNEDALPIPKYLFKFKMWPSQELTKHQCWSRPCTRTLDNPYTALIPDFQPILMFMYIWYILPWKFVELSPGIVPNPRFGAAVDGLGCQSMMERLGFNPAKLKIMLQTEATCQ